MEASEKTANMGLSNDIKTSICSSLKWGDDVRNHTRAESDESISASH